MSAVSCLRERVFRCLLPSSPLVRYSLNQNGRINRLTDLHSRNCFSTDAEKSSTENHHKHRQVKKPNIIEVLKGGTPLNNAKSPTSMLHECYRHVDNFRGNTNYHFVTKKNEKTKMFSCELKILWPTEQVFVGVAPNKKGAMQDASSKALLSLWRSRDITSSGLPILVKDPQRVSHNTTIELTPEDRQTLNELQNHFEKVKPQIDLAKSTPNSDFGGFESGSEVPIDVIYNVPRDYPILLSQKKRYYRSLSLKERMERPKNRVPLPIDNFKDELIEAMKKHRVILLRAETGSGKSSRYPQFIFEHYSSLGKGADCNIIVTQPRRLTSVSLARHVAKERNEELGDVVGYNVRLDYVLPRLPGGGILYCTAGKLLQSLILNPNLEGVSHICLDEVHERPFDCDLIMGMLRRVLKRNPNLHITLMSATLDPEEFRQYFGGECFVFDAPGRAYPVETHFLKDIPAELLQKNEEKFEYPMMARIVRWLDKKPPGGVLMFLPGWKEIQGVNNILQNDERFFVILLHSNVPIAMQYKVHEKPPKNKRKIVLATNIAESSITIADIVYVVDYPYERIGRYSYEFNELEHHLVPCPKSRLLQRRGRAGRVQAGHCYHLLTEEEFEELPEAPIPVLLRMSLDYPILVSKALIKEESVRTFLAELLTPPSDDHIENGIKSLLELEALDTEEKLTPLGKRLLCFGLEPRPAKAVVLSSILRCQNTVAAYCAAAEALPFNMFSNFPHALKSTDVHPTSDHMVVINLFHLWLEMRNEHLAWQRLAESSRLSLSYGECAMAYRIMLNILDRLRSSKLILEASPDCLEPGELQKEEFLKGILLNVHKSLGIMKKSNFRGPIPTNKSRITTLSGKLLIFARESVFYKKNVEFSSPYLFHHPSVDTGAVVTSRNTSLVSPLSVLLFMAEPLKVTTESDENNEKKKIVTFNKIVKIEMNKSDCENLLKLREVMWETIDYFVRKEGTSEKSSIGYQEIDHFREHLIQVLDGILNASSPAHGKRTIQSQVVDLFSEEEKT